MTKPFVEKIDKPWGYELILTSPDSPVTGKILHLNQGARWSYQYHEKKQENLILINGRAKIILDDQEEEMEPKKGFFILNSILKGSHQKVKLRRQRKRGSAGFLLSLDF